MCRGKSRFPFDGIWRVGAMLLSCFAHVFAQHVNVQVGDSFSEKSYYPNEPSIAINPKNRNQMIVTANGPVESTTSFRTQKVIPVAFI